MSLPNYYQILEVPVTATSAEIKAAYRRLAKIFHPDKNSGNPAAEEKFKQIKDAYENLINPLRRRKYDEKRNRSITNRPGTSFAKKTATKKNYSFSEEEAERRKYYQKNYKTSSYTAPKSQTKKETVVSAEIKYILLSVPIAVALLLLIIRLYEKPKKEAENNPTEISVAKRSDIGTSESPYESALGKNLYDSASHAVIKITNKSGYDAIVFLQNDSLKTIRHHFIENNYQLYMENIPASTYRIYSWLGTKFNSTKLLHNEYLGNYERTLSVNLLDSNLKIMSRSKDTIVVSLAVKNSGKTASVLLKSIFRKR